MLVDAKFVSLEVQYIDGTKIEANANKYTFVWKKATKTNQDKLGARDEVVGGMKSELVPTNQAKLTLPPLSSYIKKKGDDLISHPLSFLSFVFNFCSNFSNCLYVFDYVVPHGVCLICCK